jgi:hypothetical protein
VAGPASLMTDESLRQRAQKVDAIYKKYLDELMRLKKKQDAVIDNFIKALESKKIKKIRKDLGLD